LTTSSSSCSGWWRTRPIGLGATLLWDVKNEDFEWTTLADVEANEFGVVKPNRADATRSLSCHTQRPPLATDHVLSETRPVSDDRDTAEACTEHPSCIRGFIAKPKYGYPNAAGWWHLEWDQADELWHATDPGGEAKDVQVRGEEKLTPPVALIGAFQYVPFHVVVDAIRRKGLFPPEPA
jgi:hypothetical protein